jgi:tol-pal system protein YbgF
MLMPGTRVPRAGALSRAFQGATVVLRVMTSLKWRSLPRTILLPGGWILLSVSVLGLLLPGQALAQQQRDPVFATQSQIGVLELRLERAERILDAAALTEWVQSMDALTFELRQLRGRIESLEHELQSLRGRQRDQFRNMDERVSLLEGGTWTPPADEVISGTGSSSLLGADEQRSYEDAFDRLMAGDYQTAIRRFERFLEAYPQGLFAANALYWLAEARYATGDFRAARQDFLALRERHPESDKRGDALLKIGFTEVELGNPEVATDILQEVVQTYPGTVLSRLAQERLRRLQGS